MTASTSRTTDGCPCGATTFAIDGPPIFRVLCHCTICRAFNGAPYADVTAFRARDVRLADEDTVAYRAWKKPPIVQRGRCVACEAAAIEQVRAPLVPDLTIIPTANIARGDRVPAPSMHIYYDRRVADVDDDLPKHGGALSSQLAFATGLIRGLRRGTGSR